MRLLDGITSSMDMSLSKILELLMDRKACRAVVHGVAKSLPDWVTELNWTELNTYYSMKRIFNNMEENPVKENIMEV